MSSRARPEEIPYVRHGATWRGGVEDDAGLGRVAEVDQAEYGSDWHLEVADGRFEQAGHQAVVFRVAPVTAFGFAKGAYGQARWRFPAAR